MFAVLTTILDKTDGVLAFTTGTQGGITQI